MNDQLKSVWQAIRFQVFTKHRWLSLIIFLLVLVFWFIPPVWNLREGPLTVTRWVRKQGEIEAQVSPGGSNWIALSKVSKHILHAIIVAEDSRFYSHGGLDLSEIARSMETNYKKGKYVRGASTITQQVIKMAFLSRQKSLLRKMREAVGALLAERILTKNQILEWYINLAEFGDGVYGLKAAALHYFSTKPELLTIQQGTHLALVLPSPNGWSVGLRRRDLTDFGHRRFAQIINGMRQGGYVTDTLWLQCLATGNFGNPIKGYGRILEQYQVAQHEMKQGLSTPEEAQLKVFSFEPLPNAQPSAEEEDSSEELSGPSIGPPPKDPEAVQPSSQPPAESTNSASVPDSATQTDSSTTEASEPSGQEPGEELLQEEAQPDLGGD